MELRSTKGSERQHRRPLECSKDTVRKPCRCPARSREGGGAIAVENYCTVSTKASWQAHIVYDTKAKVEPTIVERNEEFQDDRLGFFDVFGSAREIRVDFYLYTNLLDSQREAKLEKVWIGYAAEDIWKAICKDIPIGNTHAAYLGYLLNEAERLLSPDVSRKARPDMGTLSDGQVIIQPLA